MRANFGPGISLEKSAQMASQMRTILHQWPEVKLVSSQTGRNDSGTDPYGPNRNEMFVALNPYDTWPQGMNKSKLVEEFAAKPAPGHPRRVVQLHPADRRQRHRGRHRQRG